MEAQDDKPMKIASICTSLALAVIASMLQPGSACPGTVGPPLLPEN